MPALPPAILLMGPTASGKTDLAVALVESLPCEIVSVDSAMVYRGMDIGTAKPDAQTLAKAPHRLIDIRDPAQAYSAAQFRADALREMGEIAAAGRIPLLVGGTMLYFRALQFGLSALPAAEPALRIRLVAEARARGAEVMHARLAAVDPASAARIHPNDPQRVQRALEVFELTGRPLSALTGQHPPGALPYRLIKLALLPEDRERLRKRIAERFLAMLDQGFEAEVRGLLARGDLGAELPSMRAVGYRQMRAYLEGETGFEEMARRAVIATRQLAKRQLTWLRAERDVHALPVEAPHIDAEALKVIRQALK